MSLTGNVAWITGAGTGIGRAGAEALAAAGAKVVLSGRRREPLEEVAKRIGAAAEVQPLDVSDRTAVERVSAAIHARHGHVDILVNSAGLNFPKRFWADTTPDNWQKVVGINLDGTAYCVFAVLPKMRERRSGLIVNVSSWAGRYDAQFTGAAYNA